MAKNYSKYYLILFQSELNLYGEHKEINYSYEPEGLAALATDLHQNKYIYCHREISIGWHDFYNPQLKTSCRNQAILCDYHARGATHWSEQEQYENL